MITSSGPGGGFTSPWSEPAISIANETLATVIIAPLGGPVVPDVYTR